MKKVVFRLKRMWEGRDLWQEILDGKKTVEYRDHTEYWQKRLLNEPKPTFAWFTVGYPKNNIPRIVADITLIRVNDWKQIETHFTNVIEIKDHLTLENIMKLYDHHPTEITWTADYFQKESERGMRNE